MNAENGLILNVVDVEDILLPKNVGVIMKSIALKEAMMMDITMEQKISSIVKNVLRN